MNKRPMILIIDDEISNIEILSAVLEDEHEISFATSGAEALEIAGSVMPDLILLDVLMPGMDGYEVCRRIKGDPLLADVPVIFTTALGNQESERRGLELGAIDYVTKPFSPHDRPGTRAQPSGNEAAARRAGRTGRDRRADWAGQSPPAGESPCSRRRRGWRGPWPICP